MPAPPARAPRPSAADLGAGLSVAALMLPEGVAYAGIAGLPPAGALVAAVVGSLAYAAAGRSRFAIVSPTSSSAAILAAALASLAAPPMARVATTAAIVLLVGLAFVAAALLRLGALASFVSRPVLRGFAFGLAITITLRQLPTALGLPAIGGSLLALLAGLAARIGAINPASLLCFAGALAALLLLRRVRGVPAALVVLAGGIAASAWCGLAARGVALVGPIAVTLAPHLPALDGAALMRMGRLVLPLVLILFAESWGTIRSLALRHGDAVAPERELMALGLANLASGIVQGLPVGAGFSVGSANEAAGAGSRAAAVVGAVALAIAILVARPWIALLPEPVLAAVVVGALTHALDPAPLVRLWRIGRDPLIAAAAAIGVLALGVVNGMLAAILLSLVAFLRRLATPAIARLGALPGTRDYVDTARHPEAMADPRVAILRPAEPLFFANAEPVLNAVATRIVAPAATAILSLEESYDLDSTALDALLEFDRRLAGARVTLLLARARDPLRDLLARAGAADLAARSHYSVADAVDASTGSPPDAP